MTDKITFEFIDEFSAENGNLHSLTPAQLEQLKSCIQLSSYQEFASNTFDLHNVDDIFSEVKGGFCMACLYHIVNAGTQEVLYDFWTYNEEDGIIFLPDTTTNIGIFMTQFLFEKANDTIYNKTLDDAFISALQDAFDNP